MYSGSGFVGLGQKRRVRISAALPAKVDNGHRETEHPPSSYVVIVSATEWGIVPVI